ncbi:S-layer homology domain-containing protein [uncultured Arthrobacter sp.]|uniref:S-layer homology domain-containing protein n=1 Tax=uncultured Arthrobacter sp. TaxID=114050 RepID=UPI002602445E|nr:S-layer homology domain-containing protein [uncultured Arthrobacter sp.]
MLSFQRSTAALTGVLLLAASLSVGVQPASAQSVQPSPVATQEPAQSPEPQVVAPAEVAPAETGQTETASADLSELFPNGIPTQPDHTFEGDELDLGRSDGATTDGAAMSPLGAGGTLSRRGDIKVRLVTVDLADSSATVPLSSARNAIAVSSSYWKSMSNGRLSMSVAAESVNHRSAARTTDSYDQIMNKVTSELRWSYSPYTALVVFIPSVLKEGYLGYGWSSNGTSGRILMPQITNFSTNVVTHEFGHVLGLMHADSLQCSSGAPDTPYFGSDCSIRQYGDTSDLMGISRWFDTPAISSSFWDYGGFGRGDEILNVGTATGRKTYTLRPWAGTAAKRAVKFTDPRSREIYYLELRTPVGFDKNLAVGGNRGVKVVQSGGLTPASSIALMPNTRPYGGYYAPNTAWQAGSVFRTHSGTTVTINSVSNSAASVTIDAGLPFTDLRGSGFRADIEWLAANKLTTGWPDGTYRPFTAMNRDAMAAFLYRLAGVKGYKPPAKSPFRDVPTSHPFYPQIAWMESSGLSTGWTDGRYRPDQPINRDAMAAFLHRYASQFCAIGSAASYSMPSTRSFTDVTRADSFALEMSWMKQMNISTGWPDGTFRPLEPITREAMAAFVKRIDSYVDRNGGC